MSESLEMQEKYFGKSVFILSFDIEEWFHLLDIDFLEEAEKWCSYEKRLYSNCNEALKFLIDNRICASYFVLGWVAERYPDLVREIVNCGYEVGSHSYKHILIYNSSKELFREDLRKSIDIIQNITNKKVRSFRAPGFSIKEDTLWAFNVLAEEGIDIDSSIFPAFRSHGGIKAINIDRPFLINVEGKFIREFPINMFKKNFLRLPFSGGGYFRLLPYPLLKFFINRSNYIMTYFHPRDFDSNQPIIKGLPFIRKSKSYYGLKNAFPKFLTMLKEYEFVDISTAEKFIDWGKVPIFRI